MYFVSACTAVKSIRRAWAGLWLLSIALGLNQHVHAAEGFTLAEAKEIEASRGGVVFSVIASVNGRYIGWIDSGSLFVAQEPRFEPKILVSGEAGAISRAYPSSDGRTIFFVRGSLRPAFGSIAAEDTRQLLQVDAVNGGQPKRVASSSEVPQKLVFAPGGQAFATAVGQVLYEYRPDDSGSWQRRQLLQVDAGHTAATGIDDIVYSPDGKRIAFVSQRKARQSYIAVHDLEKAQTRYMDPGIFKDGSPVWSPDGTELAFVRMPGNWAMAYRFSPKREGAPWSIVAVDVRTGVSRNVWKADAGRGSVASPTFAPIWTRDDRILFGWEKTGWELLYAVPSRGGAATLLTPGDGEVNRPLLSPDGRTLVYEANFGDLARRHVWSLPLNGGAPKPLTPGRGVERGVGFTAGGYLLYRVEYRERGQPQLMIRSPRGDTSVLIQQSADARRRNEMLWNQFQPVDTITVRADDGLVSHHVLIKPKHAPPREGYPVIVASKGGPTTQARPGGGQYAMFGQYVASRGYLFVDMNYRGSIGFGLDYRLPAGGGAMGGSEVKDLEALASYLRSRGDVNPKRIGIVGLSYGGHMVGLAMSRLPEDYAVGVSLFGVADWVLEMKRDQEEGGSLSTRGPPEYIRLSERTRLEELAYQSSPTPLLDKWRGPTLFTIGDLDKQGHVESVVDLGYRLLERGVPVEFHVDPAGGHNVFPQQRVFEFFERNL